MSVLKLQELSFSYGKKPVLHNVTIDFPTHGSVFLLGRNGVGKSTLIKCILGLLTPASGDVIYQDKSLQELTRREIAQIISYVPQVNSIIPEFTVFEMVLMGANALMHPLAQPSVYDYERVDGVLELLGITPLRDSYYSKISGGEQRLTLIARALMTKSKIIVMDEPCANLDFANQHWIQRHIRTLSDLGFLIIQSSHDPNQIFRYGDSVLLLKQNQQYSYGKPDQLLTKECLHDVYEIDADVIELKGNPYVII